MKDHDIIEEAAPVIGKGKGTIRTKDFRVSNTPHTVTMRSNMTTGRVVSAELVTRAVDPFAEAALFDGDKVVCRMQFFGQYASRAWAYPIVRRALNGLMSKVGKRQRYRMNHGIKKEIA